jgi:hypothetical protein
MLNFRGILTLFVLALSVVLSAQTQIVFDHTNTPLINDTITWVEVDTANVKWVGTKNGLYSFSNNTWTRYDTGSSNIPSNTIDKFRIGPDNTIWFLNNNNGFYKFSGGTFSVYNTMNVPGLPTDSLVGLTIDSADIFFWSHNRGIIRYHSSTGAVFVIDTTNSCLLSVETLVCHTNHTLYGICRNPVTVPSILPQDKADSIKCAYNFSFVNSPTISISSYCFFNYVSPCTYSQVISDKFGYRYEVYDSTWTTRKIRTYDGSNNLVSDISYPYPPAKQLLTSPKDYCRLEAPTGVDHVYINKLPSGPGSYLALPGSPPHKVSNFDTDTFNNVWIATYNGLVGYNDSLVITSVEDLLLGILAVYPNPSTNVLNIVSEYNIPFIDIFNCTGNFVRRRRVDFGKLAIDDLNSGLYFGLYTSSERALRFRFYKL